MRREGESGFTMNNDKLKGKVKQAAGDLTGNDKLRREGKIDEAAGKAKDAIDKVKDKLTPKR
jgi:uncharacterized protein YjbJ (UPF0337 family)